MKKINTFFGYVALSLVAGLSLLAENNSASAQGCNQVEIRYKQSDCYESKNGGTASPTQGQDCTPITVCVKQQYTYAAMGGPWSTYLWAVTSGPASPAINPSNTSSTVSITWPVPGIYELTLTVTDGSGNTFTKCLSITVKDKPVAGFTFAPNNACAPATVSFTNTTAFSGTASHSWNFGDPASGGYNTSNATNPSHTYNTAGTYTVTLIAYSSMLVPGGNSSTGGHGDSISVVTCCADTFKQTVTVVNGNVSIQCISTVCAGAIAKYTAVGCTSPVWGTPVGGTIQSTSGNTVTILWGNGSLQGQLSVSCGGACTAYAAVPIVPASPVISGITNPCNTGPSTYTVPYLPGTYYTWTLTDITTATNATSLLSTYPDNNSVVINWGAATPGDTYQLTVNLDNKHLCCTSTGSLAITPRQHFSITGPGTVCAGPPGSATFFASPGGTFNWSANPATGVSPPTATGTGFYTATFSNAGNYTVVATNTSGTFCNTVDSTRVKVLAVPTPGTIQGPVTACTGSQYAYNMSTSAPSGYYYEWTITNGTFEPGALTTTTGDNVTVQWSSLSGTISVTLKQNTAPFCSVTAGSITVTQAAVGSVSGPTSVCVDGNGSYTLTGGTIPPGTNVTWSISPASLGTITAGQGTTNATVLWHGTTGSGPWTASITASTTCGSASPISVTIYPKFTLNITMSGSDVCQPGGVSLTANGGPINSQYTWSPGGATTQTITNITSPGTYTVIDTAGGCVASAQFTVQDPFAIIPVTCGVGICDVSGNTNEQLGVQILKPASGSFIYQWRTGTCSSPGTTVASTGPTPSLSDNYTALSDGNYNVLVTYGNCSKCVNFQVKKVCCPDIHTPSITKNQDSCNGYTFVGTATNTSGHTITWDFGDGTTAPGASGVPISHVYTTAGVYCVTFCIGPPTPNPTGCAGNCAATQAVVPIAPGFTYKLGCNGCLSVTNTTAVFGNPAFVSYQWNFGDATTSNLQNPGPHCYTSGGTYTVTLTVVYNDGSISCSKTTTQTVTYTPLAITNNAPVCTGTPVSFASSPGGFLTYSWNFGDGFTGFSSPIVHAYNTAGPFTVNLSVTDALGNTCTASTSFTVKPGISNCTIQPGYICPGQSATLTAPTGTYTYLWEVETSPNVFAPAPGTNNASTYTTNVPGNYHVIVTNTNGCSCTSNTVAVMQVSAPKASFSISPSKNLCSPGGIVTLTAPSVTGFTYDWYKGPFGTLLGSGSSYIAFVSSTTVFYLVVTNQYGCKDTCTITVNVSSPPPPPTVITTGYCEGVPITLAVTNYTGNITWNNGATTTSITVFSAGTYTATFTSPITGCSSSTSVVINRRPSAGLFPHYCDSIPCKCTRPFVIYAPNPLIGLFASTYQVDWYNANTNTFLYTGNPYSNGGTGVQTGSYFVIITDQNTGCKDTSNTYSVLVPPCDTCDCKGSSWGEMIVSSGAGNPIFVNCGGTDTLQCNKAYSFTTTYYCPDTNCKGKVTYSLQPPSGVPLTGTAPVNFTPTQSGLYTLTLYGWCGSKPCDSCIIKFYVKCPPCDCKGSSWDNIILAQSAGLDASGKAIITGSTTLSCKKTYKLDCNKPYILSAGFNCKDTLCKGKVTYSLVPPIGPSITGTAPLNFTPTLSGTYMLTLYGWCGDKICDSCVIKFDVVCGCDCAGSQWGDIILAQTATDNPTGIVANTQQVLKCHKSYKLDCKTAYSLNASFLCKDTACKGKVTYSLLPPTGPAITGTLPLPLTPTLSGTYTLTLYGWCGDKICDSCVIKFKVDCDCDCKGSKWSEKTLNNGNTTTTLNCKQYEWSCNQPFTINAVYNCAKAFCSDTAKYKLTPPAGPAITGNLPLTYTPSTSGTYTVVLYGYCGGKICDSCVVSFLVNCPKDTVCCKYEIKVQPGIASYTVSGGATVASQTFTVSGLASVPLSEVRAEVLSYDISSTFNNECIACKTLPYLWASTASATNIGAVPGLISLYGGATTTLFNPTGTAVYQNPREIVWNNGTTFTIAGPIGINFYLPPPPLIDCCELKARICVKFTFRDIYCSECEAIACFEVTIKK